MSTLYIPDVSEWQGPSINWRELTAKGYPVAIVRAHNGYRPDEQFERNRAEFHAAGGRLLGIYQFLAADRAAVDQAAELMHTVGKLEPSEFLICDCETGSNGGSRVHDWAGYLARSYGYETPWQYAGDSFYRADGMAHDGIPASRTWLAAYGQAEPSDPHALWQYTDSHQFPGIPGACDASEWHGTLEQLLARVGVKPAPTPNPHPPTGGPTTHPAHPYPVGIHPGGTVPSARPLQEMLKRTGWMSPDIPESDHYGPATEAGVIGFNRKHGLSDVGMSEDPEIGPRGWALLATLAYG